MKLSRREFLGSAIAAAVVAPRLKRHIYVDTETVGAGIVYETAYWLPPDPLLVLVGLWSFAAMAKLDEDVTLMQFLHGDQTVIANTREKIPCVLDVEFF